MGDILNDENKFEKLFNVEKHDKTAKIEPKLQKRLLELVKKNLLTQEIYDRRFGFAASTDVWSTQNS